ncbi:hypothetical protein L204_104179 [Cryptococcus depauperatus]|nr:hypothetical protein L204_04999 [Cryptococcus depauperatus CBS 7855]
MPILDNFSTLSSAFLPLKSTIPSAQIIQLSAFIHHLATTPIHPVYFPYLRLSAIHAARVTIVWAGVTRGRKQKVGRLQDLAGYLVMAWGGGTLVALLLGQPPSWLTSSALWVVYPVVYTLLIPTGLSAYVVDTCPALLLNLIGSCSDAMTRGTTLAMLPSLVVVNPSFRHAGLWTFSLLGALSVTGGGLLVGLFGLAEDSWKLGVPGLLRGGVLGTLDAWTAALTSIMYLALTRHFKGTSHLADMFSLIMPEDIKTRDTTAAADPLHARAICILFLGGLLMIRSFIIACRDQTRAVYSPSQKKTEIVQEVEEKVVKSPVQVRTNGTRKRTPKKSSRTT